MALSWLVLAPAVAGGQALNAPPRTDPRAVLVRMRSGFATPRGAFALGGWASGAGQAARPLGLEAVPDLAARASALGIVAVEAPFADLDPGPDPGLDPALRDDPSDPWNRLARTYRLVLPPGADAGAAARELAGATEVEDAHPEAVFRVTWSDGDRFLGAGAPARTTVQGGGFSPDDPLFVDGSQWGLSNTGAGPFGGIAGFDIGALAGWGITTGSSATILGIVDTGFDLHQPDLARNLANGTPRVIRSFNSSIEGPTGAPDDSIGHGTIVAGVALALSNNGPLLDGRGVAGVCGGTGGDSVGCRVVEVKATPTHYTDALATELAKGIIYAVTFGARAINLSFGGDQDDDTVRDAISFAARRGTVVVCGAGNGQDDHPQYPGYYARYGDGVSVAGLRSDGTLANFSSRGPQIDVAAPGQDIISTYLTYENAFGSPLRNFAYSSGTSFAAPFVTGLAGLAYTLQPGMTDNEFQEVLRRTARDLGAPGRDDTFGWGLPDAPALLDAIRLPRGFERGSVRAQSWSLVSTDTVTLSKTRMARQGCTVDGRYYAERWEVRAHVAFPPGLLFETPEVIVRTHATTGWGRGPLLEYDLGWGELIPGTATKDGFDVRTYVYQIPGPPVNCGRPGAIGFLPVEPNLAIFGWSALGLFDQPPVLTVTTPQEGESLDVDAPTMLTWTATDVDVVSAIQVVLSINEGATWTTIANLPGTATQFSFKAPCGQLGVTYRLRFRAIDRHGWTDQTVVQRVFVPSRACGAGENPDNPPAFAFLPVVPNPGLRGTQAEFRFYLPDAPSGAPTVDAEITIFDTRGRRVRSLPLSAALSGSSILTWDGRDQGGGLAPAGIYVARLTAAGQTATRRFVRL